MNSKDVNNLIEKLTSAEHAYYVLNKPIMSDGEYDKLFNDLKKIELENPDLVFEYSPTQRVTGTPDNVFEQITHKQRMYSLDNSETIQDIKTGFAEQKMVEATAFEQRQLRGEQLKIEGNTAYGNAILYNPPVGVADVWATIMTQASMPGAGKMGTYMLPGMRQEELETKRRSLSLKYPNEDFSTMSANQLDHWEQMNKEHGGNWKYGSRFRYRDPGSGGY